MGQLLLLAAAMFVSMTIEFMPGGLLPGIVADLGVDVGMAGQLVAVFALTVVLTAAPLAQATRRAPRRPLLLISFAVIVVASGLGAAAPSFGWLVAARVLAGLGHAAFWSVAGAYAAYLVPRSAIGRATAVTASGGAVASIVGGPLGNALGQALGWRAAFLAMTGAGLVVFALLLRFLPPVGGVAAGRGTPTRGRPRVPGRILLLCGLLLALVMAQSSFMTYVVPWLQNVAGFAPAAIPLYLLATGVAGAVGVAVVGGVADRRPRGALVGATAAVLVSIVLLPVAVGQPLFVVAAGCLWSASFGAVPPMLQALLMRWAPEELRSLAVALQTTAINIGIGGGALVGGALLAVTSLEALPWFSAAATALSLIGVMIGMALRRGERLIGPGNANGASEWMRERLRAAMDQLGYRPLRSARGTRGQTNTNGGSHE